MRGQLQFLQAGEVRLVWRRAIQARMSTVGVVPVEVVSNVRARGADAVVGLQVTCPLQTYQSEVEVRVVDYSMVFGVDGN